MLDFKAPHVQFAAPVEHQCSGVFTELACCDSLAEEEECLHVAGSLATLPRTAGQTGVLLVMAVSAVIHRKACESRVISLPEDLGVEEY